MRNADLTDPMNGSRNSRSATLSVFALSSLLCSFAAAQYSIDWHTIDGGGGTSAGGVYSVSGTLGQPDTGNMTGGDFVVHGGFWVSAAVQVEGAPWLYILAEGGTNVVVSWIPAAPGWVLQEALTLQTNWVDSVSGPTNPISIPAIEATMFYRLRQE